MVEYQNSPPPNSIIAILIGLFSSDDFDYNGDGKRDIIVRVGNTLVVRTYSQPDNMTLNGTELGISLDDYLCLGFHDIGGGPDKELVLVPKPNELKNVMVTSLLPDNRFTPSFSWGAMQGGAWFFGVDNTDGDPQSEILAVQPGEQFYVLGEGFTPGQSSGEQPTPKFNWENTSTQDTELLNFEIQIIAPPNFRWPSNFTYIAPGSRDFDGDQINDYGYLKIEGIDGESKVISGANHEVLFSGMVPPESLSLNFTSIQFFDVSGQGFKHLMIGGSDSGSGLRDMEIILWQNPQTNEINTSLMPFLEQGFRVVAIGNPIGLGGSVSLGIVMSHKTTGQVIVVGDGPGFYGLGNPSSHQEPSTPQADGASAYLLNLVYESAIPVQLYMPAKGLYDGAELDVNADGVVDIPGLVLQDSTSTQTAGFTVLDGTNFQPIWETTVPVGAVIDPAPFFHGFFDANGDGQKEIIFGAETVQTSDSEIHKPFSPGFQIKFIYDLNGDGFEEIIGSTPSGKVQVWSSQTAVSAVFEQQLQAFLGLRAFPNPSRGQVNLQLNLPDVGQVLVQVYDAKGTLVQTSDLGQVASGEVVLPFNLPAALPNGQYFINICTAAGCEAEKVVLER